MRLAGLLSTVERFAPGLAFHARTWFVERAVPFNRAIGVQVEEVAPDSSRVVLRLPSRRRNQNFAGTIHGGVTTAFAETVHGVAVLWQFPPARHHMVTRSLRMEFLAPARGTLWVAHRLEAAVRRGIEEELARSGRSEFELECEVKDGGGITVARLRAVYVLRRRGPDPRPAAVLMTRSPAGGGPPPSAAP